MYCLNCDSTKIKRDGHTSKGIQRFQCKDCKRYFQSIYTRVATFNKEKMSKQVQDHWDKAIARIRQEMRNSL
jgi:transposase-like protein